MREAVFVSTVRTPLTKSHRGEFNVTPGPTLAAYAVRAAVERAGIDPSSIDDVVVGCGNPEQRTGRNIGRQTVLRAGLPVDVAGTTVSRFCASGLQAVADAAGRIVVAGGESVMVAAGVESISGLQPPREGGETGVDPWIQDRLPGFYMSMIDTADLVAERYGISREAQDRYALQSQQRTAAAQAAGRFSDEILAVTTEMAVTDKSSGAVTRRTVTIDHDTCNRPDTTLSGLAALKPVKGADRFVTAGNASQLCDGAAACVMMEARSAERANLQPLGAFRGFAVAGCEPDEMGIGPVFAVPKLLRRHGLGIDDIGLWELNEAFASQVLYCRDKLGIPDERLNVNGGSISIGHPYGTSGARLVGHLLLEGRRRRVKYAIVTMCVAGGMGAAGLLEIF
jgi:acetyl-CoA acetyltransferase family protein